MNIIDTFVVVDPNLISVQFDAYDEHEFRRLFNCWNDPEYLFDFFSEHEGDLCSGFFGNINIETAIHKTRKEAQILERKILFLAKHGNFNPDDALATLFKPLSDFTTKLESLEPSKAKGALSKSWLRIYAIRPFQDDPNFYIITGGAIKLTRQMKDREHTQKELEKIKITIEYLNNPEEQQLLELY